MGVGVKPYEEQSIFSGSHYVAVIVYPGGHFERIWPFESSHWALPIYLTHFLRAELAFDPSKVFLINF